MPVVPPMVSAATGALLIPHMAPGTGRKTMLYGCYAMFGLSLVAALIIITMIWSRARALRHLGHRAGADAVDRARAAGPIHHGRRASRDQRRARPSQPQLADGMGVFAILFGVPVWGFAVLWIALATALTVRTLRRGMPFALTWWSLTFPVGHLRHRHHPAGGPHRAAGVPGGRRASPTSGLLSTWVLVAVRTFRGGLRGNLFAPPSADPIKAKKDPPATTSVR